MRRILATGGPFIALGVVPVLSHLVIVETGRVRLTLSPSLPALFKFGFVAVSASMYWILYITLLSTFALTLRPGREPLITMMARKLHGELPAEMARYTRRVTVAWCGFFAAQLAVSAALLSFAPLAVWSFFVNILDLPLVAAMFLGEYLCRRHCLSNPPRHSLAVILNMIADMKRPKNA